VRFQSAVDETRKPRHRIFPDRPQNFAQSFRAQLLCIADVGVDVNFNVPLFHDVGSFVECVFLLRTRCDINANAAPQQTINFHATRKENSSVQFTNSERAQPSPLLPQVQSLVFYNARL